MSPSPSPVPLPGAPFWPQVAVGWAALISLTLLVIGAILSYRSRLATQMSELSRRWDEAPLIEARTVITKYSSEEIRGRVQYFFETSDQDSSSRELFALLRMPDFFEDLAVMVKKKAFSFGLVKESLGGTVVIMWEAWEPAVRWLRENEGYDPSYKNFEALAKRMQKKLRKFELSPTPSGASDPQGEDRAGGPSAGSSAPS
jgi:hypothetical protein